MDYETGLDVSAHPYRKDEGHHSGGDKNGRQKGALPKQVKRWKNDGEDKQLRQEPSDQDAPPAQPCGFHGRRILAVTPLFGARSRETGPAALVPSGRATPSASSEA